MEGEARGVLSLQLVCQYGDLQYMKIMYSAAPYSISDASLSEILEAEPEQRQAYLHGM